MSNLKENEYVKEIPIHSVEELYDYMHGKKDNVFDLYNDCIFRGVSSKDYDLTPSLFREDDEKDKISSFINEKECSEYKLWLYNVYDVLIHDSFENPYVFNEDKHSKEFGILLNFFDYADKSGLKVPLSSMRRLLHTNSKHIEDNIWPPESFFEVISLAQHYGLPTRALDWSYDYKVALYFSVKDILEQNKKEKDGALCHHDGTLYCARYENEKDKNKDKDGALWAFNYKHFENSIPKTEKGISFPLVIYRPEYSINPNLRNQKGVFTILPDTGYDPTESNEDNSNKCPYYLSPNNYPLDTFISKELERNEKSGEFSINGLMPFQLKNNEKIFYKFIIDKDIKGTVR